MGLKSVVTWTVAGLVAAVTVVWYQAPELMREPLIDLNRATAGLSEKVIRVDDHEVHYLEGGSGETLVLLHGIFAEKDHWVDFARSLSDHYHIIVPDLPGFGESTRLPDGNYDYTSQVQRLDRLFDALDIGPVHLAGSSMGGTIAALYAIDHPGNIRTLGFIGAPHGIPSATPSDMDRMIESQQIPLIAHTEEEFEQMLDMLFAERPLIPWPVFRHARETAIASATDNERIFRQQLKDRYLLHSQLPLVETPSFVLWGERDRIFNASGIEVLREDLAEAEVNTLANVGHLPQMEAPGVAAKMYKDFLSRKL